MSAPSETTTEHDLGHWGRPDDVRITFTIADLGGRDACIASIQRGITNRRTPVTVIVTSAEDGLGELEVQLVAHALDDVETHAACNEQLHIALQLDPPQVERSRQLGWAQLGDEPGYSARHAGPNAVRTAVTQLVDTLLSVIEFESSDQLLLTIRSDA